MSRKVYMVHVNWAGSVFVKEQDFFREQGGFEKPWGKAWQQIEAESIEDARKKGSSLPGARPWDSD